MQYIEDTLKKVEVFAESGITPENKDLNRYQDIVPGEASICL